MPRKFAMLCSLSCILSASLLAQGLNTQASKDDWEEINFEFNSAVLSDGYPSLLRLADLLHKHAGYRVKVEGNTDNIGNERSNEKLGLARANTVRDFLVKYGATAGQIDVSTRGKRDPKYPGYKTRYSKTDVPRWMNRRVVITATDENGKTVSDGGVGEAIQAMAPPAPNPGMLRRHSEAAGPDHRTAERHEGPERRPAPRTGCGEEPAGRAGEQGERAAQAAQRRTDRPSGGCAPGEGSRSALRAAGLERRRGQQPRHYLHRQRALLRSVPPQLRACRCRASTCTSSSRKKARPISVWSTASATSRAAYLPASRT